jgi:branched-chain amino acid transport system permease protein
LPYYYLAIVMVLVTVFVMYRIQDSRLGRAWFAIRDDEVAAVSCGINLVSYKVIAFAISAAFGAVGGSFFARWVTFLSPDMFKFWESFLILCMIVLGGMGNIWGVMIGALILVSLSEVLRELLPLLGLPVEVRFLAFGLIMVLMMRYRPAGLMPIPAVAAKMRAGRVKRKKVKPTGGMKQ